MVPLTLFLKGYPDIGQVHLNTENKVSSLSSSINKQTVRGLYHICATSILLQLLGDNYRNVLKGHNMGSYARHARMRLQNYCPEKNRCSFRNCTFISAIVLI